MPDTGDDQRGQWTRTFAVRPDFLGAEPSEPGRAALELFLAEHVDEVLELGPGQGRDTRWFATAGVNVTALDFAESGLAQVVKQAELDHAAGWIEPVVADVWEPLPFADASFDACYAHILSLHDPGIVLLSTDHFQAGRALVGAG